MKSIFLFAFLLQTSYFSFCNDDILVFLYTHFRHGARAPLDINDTFYDKLGEKWTNPGELTAVGQRMHYILGLRNRNKYITKEKFLSEKFDSHEILIYSSNINRTMVSCSSQLQGFYPQDSETGAVLTDEQENIAYPRVKIDEEEIKDKINSLDKSALPYRMTLAPVRMINDNDRQMNVYDLDECKDLRDEIKQKNIDNSQEFKNYLSNFNKKYSESFSKYFGEINKTYNAYELNDICDAFLSNYWDMREMEDFKTKTNLNFTILNDDCFQFFRYYYLYSFHGDKEKTLAHIDSSKIMSKLTYFMKRRLDSNITEEDEDANFKDYSYPRMLMTSGHDSTVSADLIFLINALGLDEEKIYTFPKYASQLTLEVRTNKTITKDSTYKDYYVVGYFDDDKFLEVNADDFLTKVESYIWSDEKVNDVCGFDDIINDNDNDEDKSDNAKTAYKVLMSIFICLTAIFLASTLFLGYKLSKINKSNPPIDRHINTNQSNVTESGLKN